MNKRRGGVVNMDRISDLPEALILQILCLLAAKEAIATSVLSRQWKSHWKMMPQLNFDSPTHRLKIENVCKSLLSHKAPVLQSLHLTIGSGRCSADDIGFLIEIAITRKVRDLELRICNQIESFTLPRFLYSCETLETFKITVNAIYLDVPSSVCLKSLRTLHLHYVKFKGEESVRNLLSGCPNLEDFMVSRNSRCSVKTFTIAVPSLQRLSINSGGYGKKKPWRYVINAPSLKYFTSEGVKPIESCLMENVPELLEASIVDASRNIDDKLMGSLTLVKRLSLAFSPCGIIKFPTGSIFYKLVYLELYTNTLVCLNLFSLMLDASPKLKVLKLIDTKSLRNCLVHGGEWNQPKNVPECVLLHLETFMWECYNWREKKQREMAKYILKNANHLKRAIFSSIHSRYHSTSKHKVRVVNDLKNVGWASSSCQFQFNWEKD